MEHDLERSVRFLENVSIPDKRNLSLSYYSPRGVHTVNDDWDDTTALLMDYKPLSESILEDAAPWTNTINNLYPLFADTVQATSDGTEILEMPKGLSRCCSDALAVVENLKSKVVLKELPEEKWLENEKNNWSLIYVLYNDRLNAQNTSQEPMEHYAGTSEKNCIAELFKRENLIRESQLVIDWLESNTLERDDPILHHSDWTYGWENTLHQLLAADSIAIGSTVDIIKNVHPDAPAAQNLSLHHLDNANEKKFCQRIFMEIRCGNLEGAQKLCEDCGHPWRAAMLEGWKLFHNPNMETDIMDDDAEEYKDVEGNSSRDLWKLSAIDFCRQSELDMYEKAAVASLCGYLKEILPVCSSWEDYLWAYMRTMVDIRVESEIRDNILKSYTPLPEEYWEQKLSLSDIFTMLETSNNTTVAKESKQIDHIIQKHIILDEIPQLIELLGQQSEDPNVSTHSLRFFAHLVLFFESVGDTTNRRVCEKVIEAYINRLSAMNETQLVACYVSKLSKRKQVLFYAKHCEKILTSEERKAALDYAEEFNLDTFAITQRIVENISNRASDVDCPGNLQRKLTGADEVKISALDWLMFYEEQRAEAIVQTNALIFKFLTLGKLEAAQLALDKIPQDSINKIRSEGDVSEDVDQIMKEYLSYKAYLDAQEAFNEWFRQYKNKPTPPADLPESAQFTEKVAHKHKVSQYNAETERWKLTTSHSAKTAKTLLYNVLLFPKGWLVGAPDDDYLRSVCIPEVVLLLYAILSESGMHEEAVQLADLIAAEKYGLYKVYSKEKLGEVLEKICESSVALLNAKKDPFGNPSTA